MDKGVRLRDGTQQEEESFDSAISVEQISKTG